MKLESIRIKNYRSIEEINFELHQLDDKTFTYGLIGVNEAGKSTILKALALKDGLKNEKGEALPLQKDFKDVLQPIEIEYCYDLNELEIQELREYCAAISPPVDVASLDFIRVKLVVFFEYSAPDQVQHRIEIEDIPNDDESKLAILARLMSFLFGKSHESVFWTAEDRYLISQPINLSQFASAPDDISIPLKNCFALSGIIGQEAIQAKIALIADSTEREHLENELGEKVTDHIKKAWPDHPIEITFNISDGLINFHVHDSGTKGKAKTADQRSDGFKQFVSFLLTVSAQSKTDRLSNTILLLDEPETHLHPKAQEDLLRELIKITKNEGNNIVFFATHSNYMIDKDDLSRNYKVFKNSAEDTKREKTERERFNKKISTYASVTYEVFDIPSSDYHNELYSKLHEKYQDADLSDEKREFIMNFDTNFLNAEKTLTKDRPWKGNVNQVTLPTYIRNCIHHPDNGDTYQETELKKSIELLRLYL